MAHLNEVIMAFSHKKFQKINQAFRYLGLAVIVLQITAIGALFWGFIYTVIGACLILTLCYMGLKSYYGPQYKARIYWRLRGQARRMKEKRWWFYYLEFAVKVLPFFWVIMFLPTRSMLESKLYKKARQKWLGLQEKYGYQEAA